MKINFSVIIPNYNGYHYLKSFIPSLETAISNCPKSKFEILLIDNGSTDNSLSLLPKYYKKILFKSNIGFAAAVNHGISKSTYNYLCILNNDLILDKNWFKIIRQNISQNSSHSVFCGTNLNHYGTKIESQGFHYYMSGRCENINNGKTLEKSDLAIENSIVWGSSAAAVIYLKSAIYQVGLFDESFFAYIEDVDLSYRLNQKHYTTLIIPRAFCFHLGGGTSKKMGVLREYYTFINWIKLIYKNYTISEIVTHFPLIVIERLRNLSYLVRSSLIIYLQ